MDVNTLIGLIHQYGYFALFFCLWLGIVGMPIPDEVIVMTGGFVTSLGLLKPLPSFVFTYLGVVSGLSLGYVLGRLLGAPIIDKIAKSKKTKYLDKSYWLMEKYGSYALCISYFFPIVRHIVPYLVGINRLSFKKYALFSYTTGFVWTVILFIVGRYFGKYIGNIALWIEKYGRYGLIAFILVCILIWLIRKILIYRLASSKR